MCGSTPQHCIHLSQWLTPISHGVLTSAGMCPPRPIGRPILVLVPVPLAKPAPERRGFVIEAVAEWATPGPSFSWLCRPTYKNDTSTAKIVARARRYGRNPSSPTRGGRPDSLDSGGSGHGLRIFRTTSHRGDIVLACWLARPTATHHEVDSRL